MLKSGFSPFMKIAIAADHAGFALKEKLRLAAGRARATKWWTLAPPIRESCDYPDFAQPVARDVAQGRVGSWHPGLLYRHRNGDSRQQSGWRSRRAGAMPEDEVRLTREHNDANVLTLGARIPTRPRGQPHGAFPGHRIHRRPPCPRVAKIAQLEKSIKSENQMTAGPNSMTISGLWPKSTRKSLTPSSTKPSGSTPRLELIASENFTS